MAKRLNPLTKIRYNAVLQSFGVFMLGQKVISLILCFSITTVTFAQLPGPRAKAPAPARNDQAVKDSTDQLLEELAKMRRLAEEKKKQIGERTSVESDNRSKWTSIPGDFLVTTWNDPQSFWTVAVGELFAMTAWSIAANRMKTNVAMWNNEVQTVKDVAKSASFKELFREWRRAERVLGESLSQLSKDQLDLWLKSDRVSPLTRRKAMELKALASAEGVNIPSRPILSIEEAIARHAGIYDTIQKAVTEQKALEMVRSAGKGHSIPALKSSTDLLKDAVKLSLPTGEGALAVEITPGARAESLNVTLNAVRNVRGASARALSRRWPRAILPILLIATPLVSAGISQSYDRLIAEETRMGHGAAVRKMRFNTYAHNMMSFYHKPLLRMFIVAWKKNPFLKHRVCPVQDEKHSVIFNHYLNIVASWAFLTHLELEYAGKSMLIEEDKPPVLTEEFLKGFFEKGTAFARKINPALGKISADDWEKKIIPDLVFQGRDLYGKVPEPIEKPVPLEMEEGDVPFDN